MMVLSRTSSTRATLRQWKPVFGVLRTSKVMRGMRDLDLLLDDACPTTELMIVSMSLT